MPQPHLPPTPANSNDLKALESHPSLDVVFTLPPAALPASLEPIPKGTKFETTSISPNHSTSLYHLSPPVSPIRKPSNPRTKHKRTPSETARFKNASGSSVSISEAEESTAPFSPPLPPQRARKMIHMTPKVDSQDVPFAAVNSTKTAPRSKGVGKRKQNASGTTASTRRVARKTAHSIIERRRRSKMNEEFGVLKDMIPACNGQEMHKLAILQAGIEYVNYLEGVIGAMAQDRASGSKALGKRTRETEDVTQSPEIHSLSSYNARPPNMNPVEIASLGSPGSMSISGYRPHERQSTGSCTTSPAVLPSFSAVMDLDTIDRTEISKQRDIAPETCNGYGSGVTRSNADQEATATAALMMLTQHDRRNSVGMKVRDLLNV